MSNPIETQIRAHVTTLIELALSNKGPEAWERFYHPDAEKIDLDGVTIKGKRNILAANQSLFEKISTVRRYELVGSFVRGSRSVIVWDVDFDVSGVGTIAAVEVCIQDWKDGRIIKERFFA